MYISFEDLREIVINKKLDDAGIFIEHMGQCYEPCDITIDEDGDIIFRI